jgi:hypothetical protein
MAERCYECGQFPPCRPDCTRPLEVRRFPDDTEEQSRTATALERCNAGAAEKLMELGIHPHTYRATAPQP